MSSFNSLLEKKRQELRQLKNELQAIQLKATELSQLVPESPSPKASISHAQISPVSKSMSKVFKEYPAGDGLSNDIIGNC